MIQQYIGRSISIVNPINQFDGKGTVVSVENPMLQIQLDSPTEMIEKDSPIICGVGNGISYVRVEGTVVSCEGDEANVWMKIQSVSAGTDRAPRAEADGNVVTVWDGDEEISATLCDCSESGMRVSSLTTLSVGREMQVRVDNGNDPITLKAKVVRTKQDVDSVYVDAGLQISEADKLNRARWNHLVNNLLKKHGVAA